MKISFHFFLLEKAFFGPLFYIVFNAKFMERLPM